jgi:hypothetical protein
MKAVVMLLLVIIWPIANASVLDELKATNATRYELGKLNLSILALLLTREFQGVTIARTEFKIEKFVIEEDAEHLIVKAYLVGAASNTRQDLCTTVLNSTAMSVQFNQMSRQLWPDLAEEKHRLLENELVLKVVLRASTNESPQIEC